MENTTESNRLIAEFMELEKYHPSALEYIHNKVIYSSDQLRYHTSWDWLMPVVGKISKLILDLPVNATKADDLLDELRMFLIENNITGVYGICLKFIQWYNQNKAS